MSSFGPSPRACWEKGGCHPFWGQGPVLLAGSFQHDLGSQRWFTIQGSAPCVCEGSWGWGGTAGLWPESWLQSGSPGIPKSSLVAPQCHIRLPPLKGGISDSSSPSPNALTLLPVLAKIRIRSNLWVLRFMCYFSLANDSSLFQVRKRSPFPKGVWEGFSE